MVKIFPLLIVLLILNFSERVFAQSSATIPTQYDPFDPMTYIVHPTGGYWERTGPNSDQRDIEDPTRRVSSEWSNGYGAYYLIGKVGGTCNQLNNGNASWFDETLRTPGVLGPYKMSLVKYGYLSNSYSDGLNQNLQYANPAPASHPVNGAPGYLKTTQGFWLVLQIRVPTLQYNYLTNQYEFTGNYYEPEQSHGFSSPVASCAYNYHE